MYKSPAKTAATLSGKPAAAPAAAKTEGKVYPTHNLSVKIGDGDLQKITGLFSNESKNGTKYQSVQIKEEITIPAGATLYLFESTPRGN